MSREEIGTAAAYEKCLRALALELPELVYRDAFATIRAHVAAQAKEYAKLEEMYDRNVKTIVDREGLIRELKATVEALTKASIVRGQQLLDAKLKNYDLKKKLAEVEALKAERNRLRARIEGSPKVWLCYFDAGGGVMRLYDAFDCEGDPCEGSDREKAVRVHAVPVSPESAEKGRIPSLRGTAFDAQYIGKWAKPESAEKEEG